MASRKNYTMGVGKYYFSIKSGQQSITMNRIEKKDAIYAFLNYKNIGKNCEWLGKWNGKKFEDNTPPTAEEST